MSAATGTNHTVPAGLITHCTVLIRGHHNARHHLLPRWLHRRAHHAGLGWHDDRPLQR